MSVTTIRALSLWQPWGIAMATRRPEEPTRPVKANETRHWELKGPFPYSLAIHAAKHPFKTKGYAPEFVHQCYKYKLLNCMVYGAVLCIVWVTGCVKVDEIAVRIDDTELMFGNYVNEDDYGNFQQRYAIITDPAKLKILKSPHYIRGAQGIFTYCPREGEEYK